MRRGWRHLEGTCASFGHDRAQAAPFYGMDSLGLPAGVDESVTDRSFACCRLSGMNLEGLGENCQVIFYLDKSKKESS